jgi:hypothetical protein
VVVYNKIKNSYILRIPIFIWEKINRLTIIAIAKAQIKPTTPQSKPIKKSRGTIITARGR